MVVPRVSSPRPTIRKTRISTREIVAVVQKIAAEFQPEKIVLFGSYAYGRPTADSDVDLLVIMKTTLRPRQQRLRISRALSPHPFPMDIVVKTPQHISERLTLGDQFLRQIMEHGKVVYERHPGDRATRDEAREAVSAMTIARAYVRARLGLETGKRKKSAARKRR